MILPDIQVYGHINDMNANTIYQMDILAIENIINQAAKWQRER